MLERLGGSHLLAAALLVGLLTVVLYLPVVVVSGPERLIANRFVEPLGAADLARDLTASLSRTWGFWNRDLPWPVSLVLIAGVLAHAGQELRRCRPPLALLALGVCLGLVLVQRVAPFERVWLFLLPVYYVLAGAGLARISVPRWAGSTAAIGLACVLGALVLRSGSILTSQDTGAFPDAQAVAQSLSGRLGAQDAVLTTLPASLPELQYYFRREGLPLDALVRQPELGHTLFVVADPENTVGLTLAVPPQLAQAPLIVDSRFAHAVLYRVELSAP